MRFSDEEEKELWNPAIEKYRKNNDGDLDKSKMTRMAFREYISNPVSFAKRLMNLEMEIMQMKKEMKVKKEGDLRTIKEAYQDLKKRLGGENE